MAYKNPPTAVDIVIEVYNKGRFEGIVLIERGREPFKGQKALPGGFQEFGESLEETAVREAKEETGLDVQLSRQMKVYSNPDRDPRGHVNSVGYVARAGGVPKGGDDAADARVYSLEKIPYPLAFNHGKRVAEYLSFRRRNL